MISREDCGWKIRKISSYYERRLAMRLRAVLTGKRRYLSRHMSRPVPGSESRLQDIFEFFLTWRVKVGCGNRINPHRNGPPTKPAYSQCSDLVSFGPRVDYESWRAETVSQAAVDGPIGDARESRAEVNEVTPNNGIDRSAKQLRRLVPAALRASAPG